MAYETRYVGDGIELSQDPFLRASQLRREAERLERKAVQWPHYQEVARKAREDYDRFVAEWNDDGAVGWSPDMGVPNG